MPILLYGATGYTGRLVTAELVRLGLPFTLSGRNPTKLAELAATAGRGAPWAAAAADDPAALRNLLADASVVINCAGPFTLAGDALPAAAAETGTHYVDSTGEQTFMQHVFEDHGDTAARTGAALVPAMGFDYAPGDCLARLVCAGAEPVNELVIAYAVQGFGMTRGTLRSGLEMLGGDTLVYRDGDWRPQERGVLRSWFTFPAPLGRQRMSRYPAGEVVTVPRHTRVRSITTLLTTATTVPQPRAAALMTYAEPLLAAALRTPLRQVAHDAIGLLPEGPPEDHRRGARFTICAVARGDDGLVRRGVLHGEDIYGLTAASLSWAAHQMSAPAYDRRGALGAAAAFDPAGFLGAMAPHGISYDLDPADPA